MSNERTGRKSKIKFDGKRLWLTKPATLTADRGLERILGSVLNLPIRYWRPHFFFFGTKDEDFSRLTDNQFPKKLVFGKTHPAFSLRPLPKGSGFKVCPCTSKRSFDKSHFRYIQKDCRLSHTGYVMDRNSYLVEDIIVNLPPSIANTLLFKGEVPSECMSSVGKRKPLK